mmetsp:Transcript_22139/g.52052  ORF Transcript_22139/g.52052 Transcript_22139/m.52052 type:complete len:233 (+) Transcript_22139:2956-3654(+)
MTNQMATHGRSTVAGTTVSVKPDGTDTKMTLSDFKWIKTLCPPMNTSVRVFWRVVRTHRPTVHRMVQWIVTCLDRRLVLSPKSVDRTAHNQVTRLVMDGPSVATPTGTTILISGTKPSRRLRTVSVRMRVVDSTSTFNIPKQVVIGPSKVADKSVRTVSMSSASEIRSWGSTFITPLTLRLICARATPKNNLTSGLQLTGQDYVPPTLRLVHVMQALVVLDSLLGQSLDLKL